MRFRDAGIAATAVLVALPAIVEFAAAAELVMLERPGCTWCARWNAEIGSAYANTDEGRQAPLRRVDVTRPWPADLSGIAPDRYTPTFILVDGGTERARLRGYPGDNFFWPLLDEMLTRLPVSAGD